MSERSIKNARKYKRRHCNPPMGEKNETPSEHVKNVGKARALLEALTPQAWVSLNDHLTVENASHAQSKHTPHFSITGHNHGSLKVQDVDRRLLSY